MPSCYAGSGPGRSGGGLQLQDRSGFEEEPVDEARPPAPALGLTGHLALPDFVMA
jgi:hypothetical protein